MGDAMMDSSAQEHDSTALPVRTRIAVATAVAIAALILVLWLRYGGRSDFSDFDQLWIGARALVHGHDPYDAVPRGFPWPLYYPLPAVLVAVPFVWFPKELAHAVFASISAGVIAFSLVSGRTIRLLGLVSFAFIYALQQGQWSPLLVSAATFPSLGFLFAVKPTIGAALWTYRMSGRALALAALFTLASVIVMPGWIGEWRAAIAHSPHIRAPVTYLGGPMVLLALTRWRRPEARLLVALSLVPQTFVAYETLPLVLVPSTRIEVLILGLGGLSAELIAIAINPPGDLVSSIGVRGPLLLAFMYIPALVMVMRRPNAGELPHWLQRIFRGASVESAR
jgi:hypothetical protein